MERLIHCLQPAVIQASVRKSNEAYNFVDRDKLIEVFNFYIKEWELYERYLSQDPRQVYGNSN